MNPRATGILLIIAAALGAFVYFYELAGEGARLEAAAEGERVFPIEADDITEIALRTTDGRDARLSRADGTWQLREPVAFPADAFSADAMASALASLRSEGAFETPGPADEYGLDLASARSLSFVAGDETLELLLGNDAPVGSKRYISAGGHIHAVAHHMVNGFDKALDDLRNKDIVDFDRRRVRRIEVSWPGGRVGLDATPGTEGDDETVWRITTPLDAPADQEVVRELLSEMDFLRAEGFVDEVPSSTGFDAPAFAVRLSGPAGEEGEEAFEAGFAIGAELPDGQRVVRGDAEALYAIPGDRLDGFPRDVLAYRDKELSRFRLADAERVDLFFQQPAGDPVSIVAQRQGSDWASSPEEMDPDRILPMVSELSRLSASEILAESMGDEELVALELSPPNTIFSVRGAVPEGDEGVVAPTLAELRIGRIQAEGVVVQRPGDPIVYRLPIDVGEPKTTTCSPRRARSLPECRTGSDRASASSRCYWPSGCWAVSLPSAKTRWGVCCAATRMRGPARMS
jgi:hypothetical protein